MLNKERLENLTNEIWKGAIKLRGKFKAKDYPTVILPMIMIRRIECVLEEKRDEFKKQIIEKEPGLGEKELQIKIVRRLNLISEKNESLKEKIDNQINRLKDYRKSLIHECVTGKKRIVETEKKEVHA